MSWRVLISAPYLLPALADYRSRLESAGVEIVRLDVRERLSEAELLTVVGTIDGAICGDDQFTERVLREAPKLKVISKWGTGIDSIDIEAAAKLGIQVCNTSNAFTDPVADTTLGFLLCFARRLPWMDRDVRSGMWTKPDLVALKERTLGVIGVGNIGKAVGRRARAFGMNLLGTDPLPAPLSFLEETGMRLVDLHELLAAADFVSLHCDLNPTSFHLIGESELALMKPSAFLINTSRGPVIDEPALARALQEHKIAGAGLDVFEVEPLPPESSFHRMSNCLLSPHNSNSDLACRSRVHESTIANLLAVLRRADGHAQ